jgi:S1-C subfamily serine protease
MTRNAATAGPFVALAFTSFIGLLAVRGAEQEFSGTTDSGTFRMWTSADGKRQVEACLLDASEDTVQWKRKDGTIASVPLNMLSENDRAFVRKRLGLGSSTPPAPLSGLGKVKTAEQLEKQAIKERTADNALTLYNFFLADPGIPAAEKSLANDRFAYWKDASQKGMERVGNHWRLPAEVTTLRRKEEEAYSEGMQLWKMGNMDTAYQAFQKASRADPDSIRGDFRLGIFHALVQRDAPEASKRFRECATKYWQRKDELNRSEKANLVATLNNLALTLVRARKTSDAFHEWERAVECGCPAPEIVQNLGLLTFLSSDQMRRSQDPRAALGLASTGRQRLEKLFFRVVRDSPDYQLDRNVGWLYMELVPEVRKSVATTKPAPVPARPSADLGRQSSSIRVVGYGTGFVVHPHYVLTSARVVENADGFLVAESQEPRRRLPAGLAAVSEARGLDLALIHCEGLMSGALTFSERPPSLGSEVRLLGYPLPNELGTSLKAIRGSIAALPPHDGMRGKLARYKDYFLYDTFIDPGAGGGPACNVQGEVVATNTAIILPHVIGGGYSAGIPAVKAVSWVKSQLPDYPRAKLAVDSAPRSWEAAVERVAASTVRILVWQTPDRVSLDKRQQDGKPNRSRWQGYEDPWCLACYGRGRLKCPFKACQNGTVPGQRVDKIRTPQGEIVRTMKTRDPCPNCGGIGFVSCNCGHSRIDPLFIKGREEEQPDDTQPVAEVAQPLPGDSQPIPDGRPQSTKTTRPTTTRSRTLPENR